MDKLAAYKWTLAVIALLLLLEHRPRREAQGSNNKTWFSRRRHAHQLVFDLSLLFFQIFVLSELMSWIGRQTNSITHLASPIRKTLTIDLGQIFPTLSRSTIFLVTAVLFLCVWDFFQYWSHRLLHYEPFWKLLHRFHHGSRMYALTTFRHHPLEHVFLHATITVPSSALYSFVFPSGNYFAFWLAASVQSLLLHSDLSIPRIPLLSVMVLTPNHHKLHHDINRHKSVNFGQYFTIWDRIFGTFLSPYQINLRGVSTGQDNLFKENARQLSVR